MLLTASAARQQDGAPLSPPMSFFSVRPLILPPCLHSVNLSFFCCDSRIPSGDVYLKMVSATFSDLFNSKRLLPLPPFIHHCPLAPPSVCLFFYSVPPHHPIPIPPAPPLALCLLNSDIIYRGSSWRLISQHKSLSLGRPVLTRHPLPPPPPSPHPPGPPRPFSPGLLFVASYSACDKQRKVVSCLAQYVGGGQRELICVPVSVSEQLK